MIPRVGTLWCQLTGAHFGKGEPWISGGQQAVCEPVRHPHSAWVEIHPLYSVLVNLYLN